MHLWGNVGSTNEREVACVISEGVGGVAGVVDHPPFLRQRRGNECHRSAER
ncbi:MAG: hypothetical protein WBA42_00480 [Mesorhizobium sp.]